MAENFSPQRLLMLLPNLYKVTSLPTVDPTFFGAESASVFRPYLWNPAERYFLTEKGKQVKLDRAADTVVDAIYGKALQVDPTAGQVADLGVKVDADLGVSYSLTGVLMPLWDQQPTEDSRYYPFYHASFPNPRVGYDEKAGVIEARGFKESGLVLALDFEDIAGIGAELVANGGFETYPASPGPPTSWFTGGLSTGVTREKETSITHSGSTAFKITVDWSVAALNDVPAITQIIAGLVNGKTYIYEAWYYVVQYQADSAGGLVTKIQNETIPNSGNSVGVDPTLPSVGIWTKLSFVFSPRPSESYKIVLGAFRSSNPGAGADIFVFDDVTVKEFRVTDLSGTGNHGAPRNRSNDSNVVANPGFETYTTTPGVPDSWADASGGSATFAKETTIKRAGANSVKITAGATPTATEGLKQTLSGLVDGFSYNVLAYARTSGAEGERARVRVWNATDSVEVGTSSGTDADTIFGSIIVAHFTKVAGKTYEIQLLHDGTPTAGDIIYFDDAFAIQREIGYTGYGKVGKVGLTMELVGAEERIVVLNSASLGLTGEFTLETWVELDSQTVSRGLIGKIDGTSGTNRVGFGFRLTASDKLELECGDGVTGFFLTGPTSVPEAGTTWTYCVVTRSADGTGRIYLNATLDATGPVGTTLAASAVNLNIGARFPSSAFLDGRPDSTRVLNRALSQAEITARYNAGVGRRAETYLSYALGWKPRALTTFNLVVDGSAGTSKLYVNGVLRDTLSRALTVGLAETLRNRREFAQSGVTGKTNLECYFAHKAALTAAQVLDLDRMFRTGFTAESRWVRHAMALGMMFAEWESIAFVFASFRRINEATNGSLTKLGEDFRVFRRAGESDTLLRTRIKNRLLEFFSEGTANQLIEVAAAAAGLAKTDITLRLNKDASDVEKQAFFTIQVPPGNEGVHTAIDDAMKAAKLAGVKHQVGSTGSFAYGGNGYGVGAYNYVR